MADSRVLSGFPHRARVSPLRGRTAVVTGAARGIGASLALGLAERGARVALVGLEEDRLAETARSLPFEAVPYTADTTDHRAMARVAARIEERLGPPSVVVANAGVATGGAFEREAPDVWRRVVDVNLVGSANTARAFLPGLERTRGYFLQIASLAALAPAPLMTAYCASKAGAEAFAQSLRAEIAHRGVGVGVAFLSWTDTEMIRAAGHEDAFRTLRSRLPWPADKVHPVEAGTERVLRGIENRSPYVYAQRWLPAARLVRAVSPGLVARRSRRVLGGPDPDEGRPTGLLGEGGRAAGHGPPGGDA
ncbi:SDR family oxidoreductase [Streptomyces nitrosporeus]|uniref:SDR family oxidoreductase n=1 Tax=Streptomyces nitrosporeus TaxID=28894 RepID=UPI0039A15FEC